MKKILMIATGGTIASKPTENGLTPQISPEDILSCVPEIAALCQVSTLQLCNLDSTNLNCDHWLAMARCIEENYRDYDGFVITHGTDTMAYSAAALSYLVQNSRKPIVLTGSQKSIYLRDTDARRNLHDAFLYACDDHAHNVHLVFDGKVILGTRARKTRTKSFNAFSSIDYPEIAVVRGGKLVYFVPDTMAYPRYPLFYHALDPKVFVLKLIPGIDPSILSYLKEHYDAVILESFGVGGVPSYNGDSAFTDAIQDWIASGKTMIITTQLPHEGSDMAVYEVGHSIKNEYGVLENYDMPLEAVVTKTMWILGQTKDPEAVRHIFYTPIQKDILSN